MYLVQMIRTVKVRMAGICDVTLKNVITRHRHSANIAANADININRGVYDRFRARRLAYDCPFAAPGKIIISEIANSKLVR